MGRSRSRQGVHGGNVMPSFLLSGLIVTFLGAVQPERGLKASHPLPKPAEGWSVEVISDVGEGFAPSNASLVAAPDGTLYVGRQTRAVPVSPRMFGHEGSILGIRDGRSQVVADHLGQVSGFEWIQRSLYVLH